MNKCTYVETGCGDCDWTVLLAERDQLKDRVAQLEQGCIMPPCAIGDTVFFNSSYSGKIEQGVVDRFFISKNEQCAMVKWGGFCQRFNFSDFGKAVFLTKKSAE